jgi:hypothetical protein
MRDGHDHLFSRDQRFVVEIAFRFENATGAACRNFSLHLRQFAANDLEHAFARGRGWRAIP